MSATIDKYRHLALRLYERTIAKGLRWQHDEMSSKVEAKIGQQIVSVTQSTNDNLEFLYIVEILNNAGVYLDGFNDEELGREVVPTPVAMTYYSLMQSLYELARRQATGADVALDQMLAALDQDELDDVPF